MKSIEVRQKVIEQLERVKVAVARSELESLVSPLLFSDFTVNLPQSTLKQVQEIVKVFDVLRNSSVYQAFVAHKTPEALFNPGNSSILMSYDFHIDEQQNLRLIEINTNASFLTLGSLMYEAWGLPQPFDFTDLQVKEMIHENLKDFGVMTKPRVAIIDESPENQKLFAEFLLYQALFQSWGWEVSILDYREVRPQDPRFNFIYNRYTDFTFAHSTSQVLRKAYYEKELCFSPHPFDYVLLADKDRFNDLQSEENLKNWGLEESDRSVLLKTLLRSTTLNDQNADELWDQRKNWFFKPKNAFGSKQTYRGSSMARGLFQKISSQEFLAQEFCPAPEREWQTSEGPKRFKFDLRVFAYKNQAQLMLARIYQGQVTNLKTPHGGFAPVTFNAYQERRQR